jgi:hypothetical protein
MSLPTKQYYAVISALRAFSRRVGTVPSDFDSYILLQENTALVERLGDALFAFGKEGFIEAVEEIINAHDALNAWFGSQEKMSAGVLEERRRDGETALSAWCSHATERF